MKRVSQEKIVSVILLAEASPAEQINQHLQNIVSQTYKNLDIIVSYISTNNLTDLIARWNETSFNIQWLPCPEGIELLNNAISKADGEYIFYKTVNPVIWYSRHIEHHIELFYDQKFKSLWSYSFLEYRNIKEQNQPINVAGYRINTDNILKEQVLLDELVHHISVKPEWEKCIIKTQNNQIMFLPGMVFQNWKKYRFVNPTEITITQWIDPQPQQQIVEIGKPVSLNNVTEEVIETENGDLDVKVEFPTLVGNIQYEEHNNKILEKIEKIEPEKIKTIAIKRTIGMGDVILTEPIFKVLRKKYPNAKITMYVGNSRGAKDIVKYFKSKPDEIIDIDENLIVQDYLYTQKGYDLRFDLDLSYESHLGFNYIDAYFKTIGLKEIMVNDGNDNLEMVKYVKDEEKIPQLEYIEERIIKEKYVAVELAGSGWGGKELEIEKWKQVLHLFTIGQGYKIAFVSNQKTINEFALPVGNDNLFINSNNDFNTMLNYLRYCEFFIGTDCGPMHIATGFGKKCFVINGSALSTKTSYSKNIYAVKNNNLTCLGCKHRQFLNDNGQGGLTFVAKCENTNQYQCMKDITTDYLLEEFAKFIKL